MQGVSKMVFGIIGWLALVVLLVRFISVAKDTQ